MKKIAMLLATVVVMFGVTTTAFAQWAVQEPAAESPFYGRLDLQYQATKQKDEQSSLFGKVFYAEYATGEKFAVTMSGYHDKEYWELIPGIAYQASDAVQVGLGAGRARYDGRNWTVVNPWVWYEKGKTKALLFVEYIRDDEEEPWFLRGYVERMLGEKHFVGVYGETFLGLGPMFGTYLTEKVRLWAMVPVVDKGDKRLMAGLSLEF